MILVRDTCFLAFFLLVCFVLFPSANFPLPSSLFPPLSEAVFTQAAEHAHVAHGRRKDSRYTVVLGMTPKGSHLFSQLSTRERDPDGITRR